MNKKAPIINFEGMKFDGSRRARLLRDKRWRTRRAVKNRLGVANNLRNALTNFLEI